MNALKGVISCNRIQLSDLLADNIHPKQLKQAKNNDKKVNAYLFKYKSGFYSVGGFLVTPKDVNDKLPCIIFNRGGYKDDAIIKPLRLFTEFAEFANAGYVVIGSQNLGNNFSDGMDRYGDDDDIKAVLDLQKVIISNRFINASKIGMMGWSRGAMTTFRCLSMVDWISAAVVGGAPVDFVEISKTNSALAEEFKESFGRSVTELKKRSVLYWVDKLPKHTPILLMQGSADNKVNPLGAIRLAKELSKYKIPHHLVMFEGANHGISKPRRKSDQIIIEWFDKFLKFE